jgi:hypothetical protein
MLRTDRVLAALEAKAGQFSGHNAEVSGALKAYNAALKELASLGRAEVDARLGAVPWPGARPTAEHDAYPDLVIPFHADWRSHQQARDWARDVLGGRPTIAVDGSQIAPTKDVSLPVGAVQIGWFVNQHAQGAPYVKEIAFDVLSPDELADEDEGGGGLSDWRVNARRFVGECEKIAELMVAHRDVDVKPICFFDGSLVISFAGQMRPERQRVYVDAVTDLLRVSAETRVPLVGYIDTSFASDLLAMLDVLTGQAASRRISDGALLRARMAWGDRTSAWVCARDDLVPAVGGGKYYHDVCFIYLKTTADGPPARLDVPRWLLDGGELDRVVDVVRAECVVGNGYPYAVETADAVAVITAEDRARFYRLFQAFAEKKGLPLRVARKAASKRGRRV